MSHCDSAPSNAVPPRRISSCAINQLRALGALQPGELSLDSDQERIAVYQRWLNDQTVFDCIEDFDRVRTVRRLLRISTSVVYPVRVVAAAIDWLASRRVLNAYEFKSLIHCRMERENPTAILYRELTAKSAYKPSGNKITLEKFLLRVPECWRELPGTALDTDFGCDLMAPSEQTLWRILQMGVLKMPALVYMFRLCATVTTRERYTLSAIEDLNAKVTEALGELQSPHRAVESVLHGLIAEAQVDTPTGRKAITRLSEWLLMANHLREVMDAYPDRAGALQFVITPNFPEFAKTVDRLRFALDRYHAAQRHARAGPLSKILPVVSAIAAHRCGEIVKLRDAYSAACATLASREEAYFDFVVDSFDQGPNGEVHALPRRTHWRVWMPQALLEDLRHSGSSVSHLARTLSRPLLEYRGVRGGEGGAGPPFFLSIFALDLMYGSHSLRADIRARRLALLSEIGIITHWEPVRGLANFSTEERPLYLCALNADRILVPIVEFALGMQIAALTFRMGFETAARAGEILQVRADGSNIEYDVGNDCGYWLAWPKGRQEAAAIGADGRERYCLCLPTLQEIERLVTDMVDAWGKHQVLSCIPQKQVMSGKSKDAPWLFRGLERGCNAGDLKYLICCLVIGFPCFGIHDLRAAVAKYRLDRGDSRAEIQEMLKHRFVNSSKRYWKQYSPQDSLEQHERRTTGHLRRRLECLDKTFVGAAL